MSQVINVSNGAQFILCDCKGSGTITTRPVQKEKECGLAGQNNVAATFSMYGGTISGNYFDGGIRWVLWCRCGDTKRHF